MTVHDPSRIGKFAREHFSSALMSDTKWRKAIEAIAAARPAVTQVSVKFIDVEEPRTIGFPPSLQCPLAYMDTAQFGPVELRAIEWLELPFDLEPILESIGRFPIERAAGGSRIIGYRA